MEVAQEWRDTPDGSLVSTAVGNESLAAGDVIGGEFMS